MDETIIGVFKERKQVDDSINELKNLGYDTKELSVMLKDFRKPSMIKIKGKAATTGAASGAAAGALLGGMAGLLTGIGAITIPGVGPFLVAGPIATSLGLTGVAATTVTGAAGGALAGSILGALISLGIPESEAKVYEEYIRAGGILLIVPTRDLREPEVREIMMNHNAFDIKTIDLASDVKSERTKKEIDRRDYGYRGVGMH